jgi:TetR/AcrR family transcriptional repressor of multidrug resistance operon
MRTRNIDKVALVKRKAMEMAVSDGLERFSVNKLAKACGISVATLYIYYKDKDDLITQIALEEGERMSSIVLNDFDPDLPFAEGLRMQWKNRAKHMIENPTAMLFFEQLRSSSYHEKVTAALTSDFKEIMGKFVKNAVEKGEINKMPVEVYWSLAFAPLYSLIRFHHEGKSIGGKTFTINDKTIWQTFELVLKALRNDDKITYTT